MNSHDINDATTIIAKARAEGRTALDESAGKTLLARFGIRSPRSAVAATATEARTMARVSVRSMARDSAVARAAGVHPVGITPP